MFVHLLCVEVGDEKTDVIALQKKVDDKKSGLRCNVLLIVE